MKRWQYSLLFSWVNLAQAIVGFLTFGIWYPDWTFSFARWYALYDIRKAQEAKNKIEK